MTTHATPSRFYPLARASKVLGRSIEDLLHGAIHDQVMLCMTYAEALSNQAARSVDEATLKQLGTGVVPPAERDARTKAFGVQWQHVANMEMPPGVWMLPGDAFRRPPEGLTAVTQEAYRCDGGQWRGIFLSQPLLLNLDEVVVLRSELHRLMAGQGSLGRTRRPVAHSVAEGADTDFSPLAFNGAASEATSPFVGPAGTRAADEQLVLLNTVGALVGLIHDKADNADTDLLIRSLLKRYKGRPGIDAETLRATFKAAVDSLAGVKTPSATD